MHMYRGTRRKKKQPTAKSCQKYPISTSNKTHHIGTNLAKKAYTHAHWQIHWTCGNAQNIEILWRNRKKKIEEKKKYRRTFIGESDHVHIFDSWKKNYKEQNWSEHNEPDETMCTVAWVVKTNAKHSTGREREPKMVRHAHTQNQWIVQMRWIDGNEGKKWMKWMCVFFSLLLALLFGDSKYDKKKLSIELQGNLSIYFLIFLNLVFCLLPFAICVCESRNYRRTCCGLIDLDLCPIKSNWAQNVCYNRYNSQSRLSLSISLFGPLVGGIRMGCIIYIYCYVLSNLHTFPINSSLQTCSFVPWRTSRCVGLHNNVMYIQTDIVALCSILSNQDIYTNVCMKEKKKKKNNYKSISSTSNYSIDARCQTIINNIQDCWQWKRQQQHQHHNQACGLLVIFWMASMATSAPGQEPES